MENIVVRQMIKKDLVDLTKWGEHEDIRFLHYNFPYRNKIEYAFWYRSKNKFWSRRIFSIIVNRNTVGYITLKKIKWIKRIAEMGIAIDVNYLNNGIGTNSIIDYLNIAFNQFKLKTIWLKTASFNDRAIKCYKKVGFKAYKTSIDPFEDQTYAFKLIMNYDEFTMFENKACTEYIYMKIDSKDYKEKYKR